MALMKHLSFIEQISSVTPTKQIKLRTWQENPEKGSTVWIPGKTIPERIPWEPQWRTCFEAYNRGEVFMKEWQCEEYMRAKHDLAMKYQMKYYGITIQQDLFGNTENMEIVRETSKVKRQ